MGDEHEGRRRGVGRGAAVSGVTGEELPQAAVFEEAVEGGQWILGPQVAALEAQLAQFAGVKHAVACANGTDALLLILRAWNIGPGDAVFVPSFTFAATAEVVSLAGASPVFVDVLEDTFNMDPASLQTAIELVRGDGKLKPRAVIPVDLFGQPADYRKLEPIVRREKLLMLVDTAQAFGATLDGKQTAATGDAAATSFFPAKPLGCYGDGGAIVTDDAALVEVLKSLRVHGQHGTDKYDNVRIGLTSRLDTIQAAVLIEKLKIFQDEIAARNRVADRYAGALKDVCIVPVVPEGLTSVWAQYTIRLKPGMRIALAAVAAEMLPADTIYVDETITHMPQIAGLADNHVVVEKVEEKYGLTRAQIMFTFSHNHCGPRLGDDLIDYYPVDEEQMKLVEE